MTVKAGRYDSVLVTGPARVIATHSGNGRVLLARLRKVVDEDSDTRL